MSINDGRKENIRIVYENLDEIINASWTACGWGHFEDFENMRARARQLRDAIIEWKSVQPAKNQKEGADILGYQWRIGSVSEISKI